MPNYDYINARLRAMTRRLIDEEGRRALRDQPSMEGLLNQLGQTPYAQAVSQARLETNGLPAAMRAIQAHFRARIQKIRRFFGGTTPVDPLLYRYDVQNVLAILNGFAQNTSRDRIRQALLPLSTIYTHTVEHASTWQEARDMLLTLADAPWRQALAAGSIEAITEQLYAWYYGQQPEHDLVAEALRRQADQQNIMRALREQTDFVPAGHIAHTRLTEAAHTEGIKLAVDVLMKETTYRQPLSEGLAAYQHTQRLSEFEDALTTQRHAWQRQHIRRDPLGVGVVVGYLAALHEEVQALRLLAQKKGLGV